MDWETGLRLEQIIQNQAELARRLELLMKAANIPTEEEEVKPKKRKGSES